MGTSSESGGSHPIFCRPGFLFLPFRVLEFRTFQRPRISPTNDRVDQGVLASRRVGCTALRFRTNFVFPVATRFLWWCHNISSLSIAP